MSMVTGWELFARQCLVGEKGAMAVPREMCRNLKDAVSKSPQTYAFYHAELLQMLSRAQTVSPTGRFVCGGDQTETSLGLTIL